MLHINKNRVVVTPKYAFTQIWRAKKDIKFKKLNFL